MGFKIRCSTTKRKSNISRVWGIIKKFNNRKYVGNTHDIFPSGNVVKQIIQNMRQTNVYINL